MILNRTSETTQKVEAKGSFDKEEPAVYRGCTDPHECEPIYCHICEADFMAWCEKHPEFINQ